MNIFSSKKFLRDKIEKTHKELEKVAGPSIQVIMEELRKLESKLHEERLIISEGTYDGSRTIIMVGVLSQMLVDMEFSDKKDPWKIDAPTLDDAILEIVLRDVANSRKDSKAFTEKMTSMFLDKLRDTKLTKAQEKRESKFKENLKETEITFEKTGKQQGGNYV